MVRMKCTEMDETLKLLNGLQNNLYKRMEICQYAQQNGVIPIFAYGSLLWNPIEYVDGIIYNCTLQGYSKGFFCEDFVYRGTMDFTGLTMGLREDPCEYVTGALLMSNTDQIIPFLKAFVKRETPTSINGIVMDIYKYDFVKVMLPDGTTEGYALTCVVNTNSLFYSTQSLTLQQQATKMSRAYGQSGTNLQYLKRALDTYKKYDLYDSCTCKLQDLYVQVEACRQDLSMNDQQWLQVYDELQTLEERQNTAKSCCSMTIWANVESHVSRSVYLHELINTH